MLLGTGMGAGDGGKSGGYDAWGQVAREWAFLVDQVGATRREAPGG